MKKKKVLSSLQLVIIIILLILTIMILLINNNNNNNNNNSNYNYNYNNNVNEMIINKDNIISDDIVPISDCKDEVMRGRDEHEILSRG
jgi:hypothetical protein